MTLEEKIIGLMSEKKIACEVSEHEPAYTNKIKAWDLKILCNPSFI